MKAPAAASADALREAAQNPIASLISVPFQNNTNFSVGPYHQTQNVLNIQPVIPFKLNEDWNLITRWITPVVYQPRLSPEDGPDFGVGQTYEPAFFLSPTKPSNGIIWGFGPQFFLPTATDKTLGVNEWGGGPAFVALTMKEPWVYGVSSITSGQGPGVNRVDQMLIQLLRQLQSAGKGWDPVFSRHHVELGRVGERSMARRRSAADWAAIQDPTSNP